MKTFLVPVDFSPVTEGIIDTALTFARAFAGRVVLLHVVPPPIITGEYPLPVATVQETVAGGEKAATGKLAGYAETFRHAGFALETRVCYGPLVPVILQEAETTRADYIIMGSHGHGKIYDLLVGSTASGVLKGARCGVIILPSTDRAG